MLDTLEFVVEETLRSHLDLRLVVSSRAYGLGETS